MLEQLNDSLVIIIQQTNHNLPMLGKIVLVFWLSYFLTCLSGKRLLGLGIQPRCRRGLVGIVFAPFLHANFNHLFFNTIPLVVLSNFLLIHGVHYFLTVSLAITLLSGFLIWCFGKPGLHVGASALITGYWGLLVSNIYQQGTLIAVLLGVVCLYYFVGILYSVFPAKKGISWEGHLFGLISGVLLSYYPVILTYLSL